MTAKTKCFTVPIVINRRCPASLSDPFKDHSGADLGQVLRRLSKDPQWTDLQTVLGPFLPAGTYEESVYFLPAAFDHVYEQREGSIDLQDSLAWFPSEYADQLAHEGAIEPCRAAIAQLLQHWVSSFQIDHYDLEACRNKGWPHTYRDLVRLSAEISDFTNRLVQFQVHQDIAVDFYNRLAASTDQAIASAWLLELWRAQGDVYDPPGHAPITKVLNDPENLKAALNTLRDSTLVRNAPSPTYWRDMFSSFEGVS